MQVDILEQTDEGITFGYNGIKLFVKDCTITLMSIEEFEWAVDECNANRGPKYGFRIL
jgi:hypothetical protein